MNRTKHATAIAIFASMENGNKHYTKVSVDKIRYLLAKYHDLQIQRRWLFYCLKDMEQRGYIRRRKRYDKRGAGEIRQYSSMISFTLAGIRYLVTKKINGARELLQRMLKFINAKDKRFPFQQPTGPGPTPEQIKENRTRMRKIIDGLT